MFPFLGFGTEVLIWVNEYKYISHYNFTRVLLLFDHFVKEQISVWVDENPRSWGFVSSTRTSLYGFHVLTLRPPFVSVLCCNVRRILGEGSERTSTFSGPHTFSLRKRVRTNGPPP